MRLNEEKFLYFDILEIPMTVEMNVVSGVHGPTVPRLVRIGPRFSIFVVLAWSKTSNF